MSSVVETRSFQAETAELLQLVIHSLYPSKDLFLRELLSNASDALDRLRFEGMLDPNLLEGEPALEIRLDADPQARTLTISDTGIGMRRQELIDHIGTIARSGTREFARQLHAAAPTTQLAELIGQFGVGFYAAFMVAQRVKIVTRRAGAPVATEWVSTGDGTFTVRDAERAGRGTTVTLELKNADAEAGLADYADYWTLATLVTRYSDYISYPIRAAKPDSAGELAILNSMKPLWRRAPADVAPEEHADFYRRLTEDWTPPLRTIHFHAEGTLEYDALLYVPAAARPDLYYVAPDWGLQLLTRRVTIDAKSKEILPSYLRFVRGVVDCADLSLDVSRLRPQSAHQLAQIRKRVTRKVLDAFSDLLAHDRPLYVRIWSEFGRAIKEGVASDHDNKDRIVGLTLWQTSRGEDEWTTLGEYVARMHADQTHILYMTGVSRAVLEHTPHLEALRERGWEVLYMTSPVDELLLQYVSQFDGKPLKSAAKGSVVLPKAGGDASGPEPDASARHDDAEADYAGLAAFLQTRLTDYVKRVRVTSRLTTSPVCLVVEDHEYSPVLERALRTGNGPAPRRVLELNPAHPLVRGLRETHAANADDPVLPEAADVLFGIALLTEGSDIVDPVRFHRAAIETLQRAIAARPT